MVSKIYVILFVDVRKLITETWIITIKINNHQIRRYLYVLLNELKNNLSLMKVLSRFITEKVYRYFLEVDVQYPEKLHELPHDLPFSPEIMKIRKVTFSQLVW